MRELGGGIIRAHYPLNPQIEELADRDGILLWSEIPVYQVNSELPDAAPAWLNSAHAMLRQNILTNQNHPSVLLWSIGNELPTPPDDAEARYIAGAAQLAHQLDPTRPGGDGDLRLARGRLPVGVRAAGRASASTTTSAGSTPAAARPTTPTSSARSWTACTPAIRASR